MRTPLELPSHLIRDAELYAPGRLGSEAVEWILSDYPRLVGDLRQLRRRVAELDTEGAELDDLLAKLQGIARQILDL
ncbi:hypothetical protein D9M68_226330 [compost metagenome]